MDWLYCLLPGCRFWLVKSLRALSRGAGTDCKTGWPGTYRVSLLLFTWSLTPILLQAVRGHVADLSLSPSCTQVKALPSISWQSSQPMSVCYLGQHVMKLFFYPLYCTVENLMYGAFLVISYFPSHFPDDYSRLMRSNFFSSGHHNIYYLENSSSLNLWYFP